MKQGLGSAATVLLLALGLSRTPAAAQSVRTFVSGHGVDSGICGLGAPCRTFAFAVTQTSVNGEITVLDSAGYGPVILAKAVTITNPGGVEAGITAPTGQNAITITATLANITLRGLTIEGGGAGADGIDLISSEPANNITAGTLNIIDCVVKDFVGDGIAFQPTLNGVDPTPFMSVIIVDSFIIDNGINRIKFAPQGLNVFPAIYRTIISNNSTGIDLDSSGGNVVGLLTSSHIDANYVSGISLNAGTILKMRASTVNFTNFSLNKDITNTGTIILENENSIGLLNNTGNTAIARTDGTNNIGLVSGNALSKINLQ